MPSIDLSKRWPWIAGAMLLLGGLFWVNARLVQLAFQSQPACVLRVEQADRETMIDERTGDTARTSVVYQAAKPAC